MNNCLYIKHRMISLYRCFILSKNFLGNWNIPFESKSKKICCCSFLLSIKRILWKKRERNCCKNVDRVWKVWKFWLEFPKICMCCRWEGLLLLVSRLRRFLGSWLAGRGLIKIIYKYQKFSYFNLLFYHTLLYKNIVRFS